MHGNCLVAGGRVHELTELIRITATLGSILVLADHVMQHLERRTRLNGSPERVHRLLAPDSRLGIEDEGRK